MRPYENAIGKARATGLPWLTHGISAIGLFPLLMWRELNRYGLDRDGSWEFALPMGWTVMLAGLALAVPFAAIEGWTSRRVRARRASQVTAILGTFVIAQWSSLAVGLRFFASRDPVRQSDLESAISSYLILLPSYLLLVMVFHSVRIRRRRPAL